MQDLEVPWVVGFDVLPEDDPCLSLCDLVGDLLCEVCNGVWFAGQFVWAPVDRRLDFRKSPIPAGCRWAPKVFPPCGTIFRSADVLSFGPSALGGLMQPRCEVTIEMLLVVLIASRCDGSFFAFGASVSLPLLLVCPLPQ